MALNEFVDPLPQVLHFLVVQLDVLAVNEGGEEARGGVGVLRRTGLLHH